MLEDNQPIMRSGFVDDNTIFRVSTYIFECMGIMEEEQVSVRETGGESFFFVVDAEP